MSETTSKDQAKTAVKQLIEKYERVKSQERTKEYNESNTDLLVPEDKRLFENKTMTELSRPIHG